MKRRILSSLLAIAMVCAAFVGCGSTASVQTQEDKGVKEEADAAGAAEEKAEAEFDGEDPNKVPEDPYEINWYLMGYGAPDDDVASVEESVNEYLKDKINATLKIHTLDSSQYQKMLGTMIAAGEYFDLAFTANWCLDYKSYAANGAWVALDDYIPAYLPKTAEQLGDDILDNTRVNGKIYAIPALKEMAEQRGWAYRKDIAEKYDIDMDSIDNFEDLIPVLKLIQENEPDMQFPIDWGIDRAPNNFMKYYTLGATAVIFYDTDTYGDYRGKVVNLVDTPEYLEACKLARRFYEEGLIKKDVMTATDFEQRIKDGKTFCWAEFLKPGKAEEISASYGVEVATANVRPIWKDNGTGLGSMMAVSKTSKNPERVMLFLELLNTDEYLNNLINFGIEGKHYTKLDGDYIKVNENTTYTRQGATWITGNVFLNYLMEDESPDKVEQLKEFNADAREPECYGFAFDPEAVEMEIAACNTVMQEYRSQVLLGSMDPEPVMEEYRVKLKDAGIDKIIEEGQRQYDEFLAGKAE